MDVYYKIIKCRNNAYILENQYKVDRMPCSVSYEMYDSQSQSITNG